MQECHRYKVKVTIKGVESTIFNGYHVKGLFKAILWARQQGFKVRVYRNGVEVKGK
jgi:hypothetical protein